jgi:hypothetical protein
LPLLIFQAHQDVLAGVFALHSRRVAREKRNALTLVITRR